MARQTVAFGGRLVFIIIRDNICIYLYALQEARAINRRCVCLLVQELAVPRAQGKGKRGRAGPMDRRELGMREGKQPSSRDAPGGCSHVHKAVTRENRGFDCRVAFQWFSLKVV